MKQQKVHYYYIWNALNETAEFQYYYIGKKWISKTQKRLTNQIVRMVKKHWQKHGPMGKNVATQAKKN